MTEPKKLYLDIETLNEDDIVLVDRQELEALVGLDIEGFKDDTIPYINLAEYQDIIFEMYADGEEGALEDGEELLEEATDPKRTLH